MFSCLFSFKVGWKHLQLFKFIQLTVVYHPVKCHGILSFVYVNWNAPGKLVFFFSTFFLIQKFGKNFSN